MLSLHIKSKRVEYKFDLHAKYTVITGPSGVGKTKFYELVSDLYAGVNGIQNSTGVELIPVPTNPRAFNFDSVEGAVYVLDENNLLLHQPDSARLFQQSNNYFIIMTRDLRAISYLPVALDNVKIMKASGSFHTLEPKYDLSKYHLNNADIQTVIIEDEKSGYKFIKEWATCNTSQVLLEPAFGTEEQRVQKTHSANNKVCASVKYHLSRGAIKVAVVFDTLGFSGYIEELLALWLRYHGRVSLIPWGCYEAYILASPWLQVLKGELDTDYTVDNIEAYCHKLYADIIGSKGKGSISKCVHRSACRTCTINSQCKYPRWKDKDLIYGPVGQLIEYLNTVKSIQHTVEDSASVRSDGVNSNQCDKCNLSDLRMFGKCE